MRPGPSIESDRTGHGPIRSALLAFAQLALLAVFVPVGTAHAQEEAGERRTITPEDYARFESLGQASFSADASHLAVSVSRFDDDGEVRIVPLDGSEPRIIELATGHTMAPEGPWVGVVTGPSREDRERMRRDDTPVRNDLLLINLETGDEMEVEGVQNLSFSPDGRSALLWRYPPQGNRGDVQGRDIVVRDLATGVDVNFGNVSQASWADEHAILAMIVDARDMAGNGVRLYDPESGTIRTLHTDEARFSALEWRDESLDLAVFRQDIDEERGDTLQSVLAWRDAREGDREPLVLDGAVEAPAGTPEDGPSEFAIGTMRSIRWADDGERIFVGVQPRDPAEEEVDDEAEDTEGDTDADEDEENARGNGSDEVPGVEIWHARDIDPVPQQRVRQNIERNRSHLLAWDLTGPPVLLGGGIAGESVSLFPDQRGALVLDDEPYATERMFGPVYRDVYQVDISTGQRSLLLERVEFSSGVSPDGRYYLFFRDDDFFSLNLESGEVRNITGDLPAEFANQETDVVVSQRPPYGVAGWTDDEQVLLYDRFDVWRVDPQGGGGERMTRGAEEEVRHRLVRLDFDQDTYPVDGPWMVSLYGEWTKESGYGRITSPGQVERLAWDDRMISRLSQADDGQTHYFMTQRYDDPPRLHVTGPELDDERAVVRSNAFVDDEFLVGRSELVDYESEWGERLQGALFYPADYEPGREYPMIVYHYERRSQVLNGWTNPSDRSAYNTRVFTQNGYFVLQPDIVYRPRNPGLSFMAAVLPAVDAAVATGMIDENAVGITGHSWGGYQTTFAVTQTDRFAAAVAGAPLTNLMSMYLSFYWNSGSTDARIFEISQGRMEVPWWEDFESYRANSPVHHIESMDTPLLMAFGDEDGAVEFNQGVEFYNAARRADKDFVLLVYEGENHSLSEEPNQKDYQLRALEWFDHYLKGAEAPRWITEGLPYLEQQEMLQNGPASGRNR